MLSQTSETITRRKFTLSVAALFVTPVAGGSAAQPPALHDVLGKKPDGLAPSEWAEVQARYGNLIRVYGERLSTEQRHTLVHVLTANERMLGSLRRFVVTNSDPAALTLRLVTNGQFTQ